MTTILAAQSIRVEFGPVVAVRDVSCELEGGQLLGLVGPNGAGKTTLLRVLAGLHTPTSGAALIMGKPVLGEHEVVRHHVGFAPDAPPAYDDLTIQQFLEFIAAAYGLDRAESHERVDFWLEHLWLEEKRTNKIKELSRGMRQRVTLARTFLPRPHVVLLDEPLVGLDPAGRIQLRHVLGMLRDQGCAMIVSSHILTDLEEIATHIAIIEQGSILRWSESAALHHQETDRRTYQITTLTGDSTLTILESHPKVSHVRQDGLSFSFDFHSDEKYAAELLKTLIAQGVTVTSFTPTKTSLEEVYLRSGVRQVD